MISAIREICIFMIIAQAVLFFVPGGSYMKYVRILVGILIILRITEPILAFLSDDETKQVLWNRMETMLDGLDTEEQKIWTEDRDMGIYTGIEEELKKRLESCEGSYEVVAVELEEEEGSIFVTVSSRKGERKEEDRDGIRIEPIVLYREEAGQEEMMAEKGGEEEELQRLREQYGARIGVDPQRLKIRDATGEWNGGR